MRVVLTRPEGQNEELAERLRARGHEVFVVPLTAIEPLGDDPVDLAPYDWLVVTSANGAAEVTRRARGRPRRVAAVGHVTAAALRAAGFRVDLVPARSNQKGILAELPSPAGRVLLAAAEEASMTLVDRAGADFVALYRTRELRADVPDADLVVVASGSAARALASIRTDIPVVTIGPLTTEAARAAGLAVRSEAATQDADGLADAVAAVREG